MTVRLRTQHDRYEARIPHWRGLLVRAQLGFQAQQKDFSKHCRSPLLACVEIGRQLVDISSIFRPEQGGLSLPT